MTKRPAPETSAHEADVAQLYGLPLGEFTGARNALAARLRAAGRENEARSVKQLAKPSAPVWAINQAVRRDRPAAEAFVGAVERLRQAQARRPAEVTAATDAQRAALGRLVELARHALTEAGFSGSPEMTGRVSGTLLGAAVQAAEALRQGRLTDELRAPGFEVLTGHPVELTERPDERITQRTPREESPAARRERERRERAREARNVAQAEVEEWERRADELERAAEQHHRTLEEAEAALKERRARVEEAEARVSEARLAGQQAGREAERARREAERAQAKAQAAEQAVRAARER